MIKRLLQEAFEKAETDSEKESINGRAEYLSEFILEKNKFSISGKSLTRYFKSESSPNQQVRNYLAQYLSYENYEDFILKNSDTPAQENNLKPDSTKKAIPRKSLLIIFLILPFVGIAAYVGYLAGKEKCMAWNEDHYIEVDCTGTANETKYNPILLKDFRQIKVTDTTTFFKNGEVQVWYDKSNNKLEFFTAPGIHPENGKTLKPVSNYIINKYIKS